MHGHMNLKLEFTYFFAITESKKTRFSLVNCSPYKT